MSFSVSSKGRLTHHDVGRFPGNTLFDRLARAVCEAGCLPRKELYESWEMARRVRRRLRGGRVVDLAAGHGLLSHVLLLLDDSSPEALLVDTAPPASAARLHGVLVEAWPRLAGRIVSECRPLASVQLSAGDLVVSSRFFDLPPVVARIAADRGLVGYVRNDRDVPPDKAGQAMRPSVWVVLAREEGAFGQIAQSAGRWTRLAANAGDPLWTDDFSNVLGVLAKQP